MGITVRNDKHLFLRLSVLFVCILAIFTLFSQDVFARTQDPATISNLSPVNTNTLPTSLGSEQGNTPSPSRGDEFINEVQRGPSPASGGINTPSGGNIQGNSQGSENTGADTPKQTPTQGGDSHNPPDSENETSSMIYNWGIPLGGWIASLGGSIFDGAIDQVVLKMGCWFVDDKCSDTGANGAIGAVVNSLWIVIRDLFNILFIFSLIYIGLKTIWSNDSSTKKALGLLIAAALLINFSLYVTKVIVDMSNYAAVAIHDQATKGITLEKGGYGTEVIDKKTGEVITTITAGDGKSLSGAYMQAFSLSSFFAGNNLEDKSTGKIFLFVMVFLLVSITLGIILAWGGIMLVARFVALIIFMIFSPAMFLGWVLPQFQKYSDKWWQQFLSYAFFAPAYIFMLYLGLYTLIQLEGAYTSTYADAIYKGGDSFSIFIFFVIGIVFLVAATKVGESMGIAGSNAAMGTLKGAKNKIQGGIVGGTKYGVGYGASATTGLGARKIGKWMDNGRDEKENPRGRTSRAIRSFVKKGEQKKWGGAQSSEERAKGDREEAKSHARRHAVYNFKNKLDSGNEEDIQQAFADMSPAQLIEVAKTPKGRDSIMKNAHLLTDDAMKAISNSEDINNTDTGKIAEERQKMTTQHIINGIGGAKAKGVAKASNNELKAMGISNLLDPKNAINLSKDKIEKTKFIPAHKDKLIKAHEKAVLDAAKSTSAHGVTSKELANRKAVDIAKMPKEIFKIESFVKQLPESTVKSKAFAELDPASQKSIRRIFTEYADSLPNNTNDHELNKVSEITSWFNSPGGKSFGK
jgi:hypothetical protein